MKTPWADRAKNWIEVDRYLHEHRIDRGDKRFSLFGEKLQHDPVHQEANDADNRLHKPDVWVLVFATIRWVVVTIKT